MAGKFNQKDVESLLVRCHRRCCICHRWCGSKIEIDHMAPGAEAGSNDIENAIAVCFECHAEIHSYNPQHPRGRRFRPSELMLHKQQWLEICSRRPEVFSEQLKPTDVGPLQSLIDELDFNAAVAEAYDFKDQGCPFLDDQFRRAIREGSISTLQDELKNSILQAYVAIGRANHHMAVVVPGSREYNDAGNKAMASISTAKPLIQKARTALLGFLSSEV
jgi:hypothetical protein